MSHTQGWGTPGTGAVDAHGRKGTQSVLIETCGGCDGHGERRLGVKGLRDVRGIVKVGVDPVGRPHIGGADHFVGQTGKISLGRQSCEKNNKGRSTTAKILKVEHGSYKIHRNTPTRCPVRMIFVSGVLQRLKERPSPRCPFTLDPIREQLASEHLPAQRPTGHS